MEGDDLVDHRQRHHVSEAANRGRIGCELEGVVTGFIVEPVELSDNDGGFLSGELDGFLHGEVSENLDGGWKVRGALGPDVGEIPVSDATVLLHDGRVHMELADRHDDDSWGVFVVEPGAFLPVQSAESFAVEVDVCRYDLIH